MQKLKLSNDTVNVLKNFNQINPMIYFRKGKVISTLAPGKTIIARYECEEEFKSDFGIYKLDKLLSVLSFFEEPEIEIGEKNLKVKSNGHTAKLAFADPAVLVFSEKQCANLPTIDAEFDITEAHLNTITKAFSVMELPVVAFESDGKKLAMKALDPKNPSGDDYVIDLTGEADKTFTAMFSIANLKLIPASYKVQISSKGIAQFSGDKITYWIAVEKDSKFQ